MKFQKIKNKYLKRRVNIKKFILFFVWLHGVRVRGLGLASVASERGNIREFRVFVWGVMCSLVLWGLCEGWEFLRVWGISEISQLFQGISRILFSKLSTACG